MQEDKIELILKNKFPYFLKLNREQQEKFITRLSHFISIKKFTPRAGLELNDEIKILCAAPAIQLTLGLDHYQLLYFEEILVYPDFYKNPHTGQLHKGETNLSGFMCLSFKHLLEGFFREHDNHNLGLHEFAHALRFASIKGHDGDEFFDNYFPKLIAVGEKEFLSLKNKKSSIFRVYGGANINEFFSVIVEHFFESPLQFKTMHPELYKHLCILLNQVPHPHAVELDVRKHLMQVRKSRLISNVLATSSSFGGFVPVVLSLILIVVIFIMYSSANSWYNFFYLTLLIVLLFVTFVLPRLKRVLIFEDGFLLSWMLNGVFKKEPLFIEYERLISVRLIGELKKENVEQGCKTIQLLYLYDEQFKTLEFECNFSLPFTHKLIKLLKSYSVNLMLVDIPLPNRKKKS